MIVAFLLSAAALTTPADSIHIVQRGETLYSISKTYRVTVSQLQQWNGLMDARLATGLELRVIPPLSTATAAQESDAPLSGSDPLTDTSIESASQGNSLKAEPVGRSVTYTVRSGDTLYRIGQQFNVSVTTLRSLNQLTSDQLSVGQILILRREQMTPSVVQDLPVNRPQGLFYSYQVKREETFAQILRRFSMDETEFRSLNPGIEPDDVVSGQTILVLLPPDRSFDNPYAQKGLSGQKESVSLSVYSSSDRATPTASGELINQDDYTAGHSTYPLGTVLLVQNPSNGISLLVRVNDRIRGSGLRVTAATAQFLQLTTESNSEKQVMVSVL